MKLEAGRRKMGEIEQATKHIKLQQWAQMIRECKSSGMTVRSWCNENGINEKAYYYRQRKLKKVILEMNERELQALEQPAETNFVKLTSAVTNRSSHNPMTVINVNEIKIEIDEDASEEAIRKSLKVVLESC